MAGMNKTGWRSCLRFAHSTTTLTEFRGIGWSSDIFAFLHSCIHCRLGYVSVMRKTAFVHSCIIVAFALFCREGFLHGYVIQLEDEGGS
jgi:hypothetical protein